MKLLTLTIILFALQQGIVFSHPLHVPVHIKKTEGFAVMANNDTLRGYFDINYYRGVQFNRNISVKNAYRNDSILKNNDIRSVFLAIRSAEIYNPGGFIEYDYFPKEKHFFRKIYAGKNDYYDGNTEAYNPDKISGELIIRDRSGKDTLLAKKELAANRAKKLLTDYLNDRYHTHFAYKDFKTPIQVIQKIDPLTP